MASRVLLARVAAFLLCHTLAIGVASLAAVGWLYRDAVLGVASQTDGDRGLVSAAPERPLSAAPVQPAPAEASSTVPVEPARTPVHGTPSLVFRPLEPVEPQAVEPASIPGAPEAPDLAAQAAPVMPAASPPVESSAPQPIYQPAPSVPAASPPVESSAPQPIYQPAPSVPAAARPERPLRSLTESLSSPPVTRPGVVHEQSSREALLSEARNAARASDHAAAERRYRELWERFPDDPEPAGELADLYRRQGRTDDAATAYVEAARRLVRSGQAGRAWALAGRLQAWSPPTAGVIYALVPPPTWSGSPSQPPPSLYHSLGR
jgi:hypothetical protein